MREFFNSTYTVPAVSPITSVTNEVLTAIAVDRLNFESALFEIAIGAKTDGAVAVEVQESDASGSGYTAAADADLIGLEATAGVADSTAGANSVRKIGYKGIKRYLKLVLTITSNAGSLPISATCLLGHGRHVPAQGADGAAITQVP